MSSLFGPGDEYLI